MNWAAWCFGGLLVWGVSAIAQPSDPWEMAAMRMMSEAEARFREGGDSPEARLGRGVALLNVQPRTPENIARARALIGEVRRSDGEPGILASYLLARIVQVHDSPPDPAAAAAAFRALHTAHPEHPLAQMGLVKAVTIELFARQANPPSQATFHEFRKISDRLTDPAARRDFHLTMAEAARAVDVDPAYRLEHLKLAFETGAIRKRDILSNTLVSIGEISASLGRTDDARAFYERFLEMFPRDGRIHLVQQRLKGLDHAANP